MTAPITASVNIRLTVEQRAALDAHRARLGLRSMGEVVRYWINKPENAEPLTLVRSRERKGSGSLHPHRRGDRE